MRWDGELTDDLSSTQMVLRLEERLRDKVKSIFPIKSVRVSNEDKPFISAEMKKLDRYVKKEYKKKGKSAKNTKLKTAYDQKYSKAASFYLNGCVTEAPGKAYRAIKKMGARPGDCGEEAGFTLVFTGSTNI